MQRIIIVHWSKSTGPEPIIQYPPESEFPSRDLFLKIWALHELDKESSIIEFIPEIGLEQYVSVVQEFEGETYFFVIVYNQNSKVEKIIKDSPEILATVSKNLTELVNTNKITRAISGIKANLQVKLFLGNLDAKRDWGFAPEYVEAMWLILNQDRPDDFVIATGETHTIKEFVTEAFNYAGYDIKWIGRGIKEKGVDKKTGKVLIEIDPRYFRPTETEILLGDASKVKKKLGWKPKIRFAELVKIMIDADMRAMNLKPIGEGDEIIKRKFSEKWWDSD